MSDLTIRPAMSDADLEAWNRVRRIVVPDEPITTIDQMRSMAAEPDRVYLLAELDGETVGSGLASDSNLADGFAMPRILPDHRRRGFGSAVLGVILDTHVAAGRHSVASHAQDEGALAFSLHHGFEEIDRQVELVRAITPGEPEPPPYPGVEFTTVAAEPDLLRRAHRLAEQGFADLVLTTGPARIPLDEWLRDEASVPGGSMVALADGEIVGYAGLIAWNDDDTRAENGLTVVDRAWRSKGLATALKRRQLRWASENGIRELVTWTQDGNAAMQRVNTRLGYVARSVSHTVRRDLP
jgi:GNAT superfamily N-acetyltransferase